MHKSLVAIALLTGLSASPAFADEAVLSGSFVGASNHITTGKIEVVKTDGGYRIALGEDFSLDGAPDPKLGFGNSGNYDTATTFAVLANLTGEQTYELPASIDPASYNEFYIWCEKFSVPLGIAALK